MGVPEDQVKLMGYEARLKWEFASPILMPDKIKSKPIFPAHPVQVHPLREC